MSNTENVNLVKKLFDACNKKEYERIRELVHPDYHLRDPMMTLNSADELIEMIKNCPSGGAENPEFVSDGDKVVTVFDGVMEGQPKMRMCSVIKVAGGKVREEEMFYDTSKIPQEMKDMMVKAKQSAGSGATAH